MEIKTCVPKRLPLKNLDWASLIPFIGEAREWLARFDEHIKQTPEKLPNHRDCANGALELAIQYATSKPLNLPFLCHLHAIIKKEDQNSKETGRLRSRQNWIGPRGCKVQDAYFYPPNPQKVKKCMQELFQYMKKREKDPLVQLAIFVAQLLIIHPFMDGNGRVARLFIPIWLWKKQLISKPTLILSDYFDKNRLKYIQKLFDVSENESWEDWIEFFLKGVIEQCQYSLQPKNSD